jgi:hypothetical protein
MKSTILLLAVFAAALSSCTTAYKTGQTPDDVYFSPARPQDEYVQVEKEDDTRKYRNDDEYYDDRYLHMKVHNRIRWNDLDDWYDYERYGVRGNYYYGTYNNPYNSWNYYYNPYSYHGNYYSPYSYPGSIVILNPKYINNTISVKPRNFSLNSYSNSNFSNTNNNLRTTNRSVISRPAYNNSNSLSNTLKQVFSGSNNNSSNNSSSRTYTPTNNSSSSSSSGSSSSSSSGSSGGSVSRPSRGN